MANTWNSGTPQAVTDMIDDLTTALGNGLELDFGNSVGFVITFKMSPDGQTVTLSAHPETQGLSLQPAFTVDVVDLP